MLKCFKARNLLLIEVKNKTKMNFFFKNTKPENNF